MPNIISLILNFNQFGFQSSQCQISSVKAKVDILNLISFGYSSKCQISLVWVTEVNAEFHQFALQ